MFAGIGGFDRGFELAGAKVVFQCESDAFCRAVLLKHWPKAMIQNDIRTLKPDEIPDTDVWTAGFPCQDVSLARGNHGRNGLTGSHTSLFFQLAKLVAEKRPRVLLLENVVGLLNSHKGQDFAIILRELTQMGYAVSWRVMNARYFGAPQSRARVFICAWLNDPGKAVSALYEEVAGEKPSTERTAFVTPTVHKATGAIVPKIAYCVAATSGRHTGNDWSRSYISYADGVRRPTATESERLQGFPADWSVPGTTATASARGWDSERYRAVGNAVAIPVVRWIAERIMRGMTDRIKSPKDGLRALAVTLAPDLARHTAEFSFSDIEQSLLRGDFVYRWKTGGCAWKDQILEGGASPAPAKIIETQFVDVLDPEVPDERYFLTPNAAVGILRRADVVGRNLFPPMRKALENLLNVSKGCKDGPVSDIGDNLDQPSLRPSRTQQRGKIREASGRSKRRLRA
ncbi:DNA (cytosine-5-)-methyltransferase [Caulobacter sp. NIBR1757]|uniref:DNA cytosine methyltransferase n=1 Tax=Caulobacter sp. NIBR1757 TaxID=3016000 RepID=UPI0022F106D4|nr:DNA (cytosine-5-)-methyltransferase [Caulobacter sp. NIBR1757]